MPLMLIDIAFAAVMASVGIALGVWLRGRKASREAEAAPNDTEYAKEALASLRVLAKRVATHVGEHSSQVEEINEELNSADRDNPEAVIDAVTRLIDANGNMQKQLGDAEVKLEEQARLVESHAEQARTDALTGLANRRAFDDEMTRRLSEYQRCNTPFAMAMLDVDKFKVFNDTHGHQAGDEVLRGIADVLRKESRGMDLVTRYGGEEMAVILGATSLDDASASAERFRRAIEETRFQYGDTEMQVTVSIGVAQVLDAEDVETLIERADAAMYASKDGGRNCVHWHDGDVVHPFGAEEPPAKVDLPVKVVDEELQQPRVPADDLARLSETLSRRLAECKRGGTPPSVLLVKIDDFAGIRSRHKRQVADLIHRAARQLLEAAVRDMDVVAEYDTDIFSVMLPGAGMGGTIAAAERLRVAVTNCTLPLSNEEFRFTVSTGAAEATAEDIPETLQGRAEEALAKAVSSGGNCGCLHDGQRCKPAASMLQQTG